MKLTPEKLTILLEHMLHHNKHHCDEIKEIADAASQLNKEDIAAVILEAKEIQDKANAKLEAALDMAKKEL